MKTNEIRKVLDDFCQKLEETKTDNDFNYKIEETSSQIGIEKKDLKMRLAIMQLWLTKRPNAIKL